MGTVCDTCSDREGYSFVHLLVLLLVHLFTPLVAFWEMPNIRCGRRTSNFPVWTEWRTIIVNNILFLPFFRTPEQCPSVVSLLSESYNPHVRYGAAMALGICCAGTGNKVRTRSICCQDWFCSLLPQRHLRGNVTHRDQISRTRTLLASWSTAVLL